MSKLLNAVKTLKKDFLNVSAEKIEKELEARNDKVVELDTNADIENVGTQYKGKELRREDTLTDVVELVPTYFSFMGAFQEGYHGTNLGVSERVRVVGEIAQGKVNAEWQTSSGGVFPDDPLTIVPTDEITITQVPMIFSVGISKRMQNYSIFDIEAYVRKEIAKQAAYTIENMVLNGDTTNAATGNINCDDEDPTSALLYGDSNVTLTTNGLRKAFLAGTAGVDYLDVGSLDFDDFLNVRALMGDWSYDLDAIVMIINGPTYNKALTIDEFQQYDKNGRTDNTINTGKLQARIAGVDYYIARGYPRTEADGKVSYDTPANNVKGGFLYAKKNSVQWGYGQQMEIDVQKVPGKGIVIYATMEFGYAILNKKVGNTSPMIVGAINATL